MILTDNEMDQVRSVIEAQAGLDEELMQRCWLLVHQGAFDEAVRSAFVLLEEHLREAVGVGPQRFLSGIRLVDAAFDPEKGSLARRLGSTQGDAYTAIVCQTRTSNFSRYVAA